MEEKNKEKQISYDDLATVYRVYQQAYSELKEGVIKHQHAILPIIAEDPEKYVAVTESMVELTVVLGNTLNHIMQGLQPITDQVKDVGAE